MGRWRGGLTSAERGALAGRALRIGGLNWTILMGELSERGYLGSYSALVRRIAPWQRELRSDMEPVDALSNGPGTQAQVD